MSVWLTHGIPPDLASRGLRLQIWTTMPRFLGGSCTIMSVLTVPLSLWSLSWLLAFAVTQLVELFIIGWSPIPGSHSWPRVHFIIGYSATPGSHSAVCVIFEGMQDPLVPNKHISYLFSLLWHNPWQSHPKERRVYFAPQFESRVHQGGKGKMTGAWGSWPH